MQQNEIEMKSKPIRSQNQSKSTILNPIPTQKWDKNKNNGFGLGPQNLIIKFNKSQPKSMKMTPNLGSNSGEIHNKLIIKFNQNQWNLLKSWPKFMVKFRENQIKSCTTPY